MYNLPTAREKTEAISFKVWNERKVSILSSLIQPNLEFPAKEVRQEEEVKGIQIGKEVVKLSLFADDMILYQKAPTQKKSTKKLLDTVKSSKAVRHKINLQNSIAFLYTNNEQTEYKYRKIISFTTA
jgi:hypothetical protein